MTIRVNGQIQPDTSIWHNDHQLHYYPNVIEYVILLEESYPPHGAAFEESLEYFLYSCTEKKYKLERIPGQFLQQSFGMLPKEFTERSKMYLRIDASGKVQTAQIVNLEDKKSIELCLMNVINSSNVYAGLRHNVKVKSSLAYFIDELK